MAGAGYRLFTAGQVLTAAQVNTYLQEQAVMVFATTAARDSALTSIKSEGMVTYQLDNNDLDIYNGSTFSTLVAPAHGALTTWTPVVTQSNTPTLTNTYSNYSRVGRRIFFESIVSLTSSGTAANDVVLTLPITAHASITGGIIGAADLFDSSASLEYDGILIAASTTTVKIRADNINVNTFLGSSAFTAALASGDSIKYHGSYEAGADA